MLLDISYYGHNEVIDEDAISVFSLRTQQRIVVITAGLSILIGIYTIIILNQYILLGLICIPLGILYSFRKPKKSRKSIKDTGIIMGNLVMVYFLTLILIN